MAGSGDVAGWTAAAARWRCVSSNTVGGREGELETKRSKTLLVLVCIE